MLLTGYHTAAIHRMGANRLESRLRNRKVRGAAALARSAFETAERQHTAVVGEKTTAQMVHTLAREMMTLNEKIAEVDKVIEDRLRVHELAPVIASLPGIGPCPELAPARGGIPGGHQRGHELLRHS